jgi:hypothetical protein
MKNQKARNRPKQNTTSLGRDEKEMNQSSIYNNENSSVMLPNINKKNGEFVMSGNIGSV